MKRAVTMANVRKALRFTLKGKDYEFLASKENDYFSTPKYLKRTSDTFEMTESERKVLGPKNTNARRSLRLTRSTSVTTSFRDAMGTLKQKIRKSTRRRMRLKSGRDSPSTPAALRRSSRIAGKNSPIPVSRSEVKLYSPFEIETPSPKPTSVSTGSLPYRLDYETPGRIRREVEALTRNMQALATLTPRTLRTRSSRNIITVSTTTSTTSVNVPPPTYRSRSPSPVLLTNGSLRPDVQARRRLQAKTPVFV